VIVFQDTSTVIPPLPRLFNSHLSEASALVTNSGNSEPSKLIQGISFASLPEPAADAMLLSSEDPSLSNSLHSIQEQIARNAKQSAAVASLLALVQRQQQQQEDDESSGQQQQAVGGGWRQQQQQQQQAVGGGWRQQQQQQDVESSGQQQEVPQGRGHGAPKPPKHELHRGDRDFGAAAAESPVGPVDLGGRPLLLWEKPSSAKKRAWREVSFAEDARSYGPSRFMPHPGASQNDPLAPSHSESRADVPKTAILDGSPYGGSNSGNMIMLYEPSCSFPLSANVSALQVSQLVGNVSGACHPPTHLITPSLAFDSVPFSSLVVMGGGNAITANVPPSQTLPSPPLPPDLASGHQSNVETRAFVRRVKLEEGGERAYEPSSRISLGPQMQARSMAAEEDDSSNKTHQDFNPVTNTGLS